MSGHANFHTISGYTALHLQPNPLVDDDIPVAGNPPAGGANGGGIGVGPQDGPQDARVDAQAESTNALVRQLDILLARAAASATQSVDATAVKAALGELGLPEDKRKALADDDYAKVVGGLMRQSNRLEWFDLITGQGDRHGGNYFVEVDPGDFTVTLKGIDNDASFPAYRKGLRTFALNENTSAQFSAKLYNIALKLYGGDRHLASTVKTELLEDPGVTVNDDDDTLTIDTTKAKSPFIAMVLRETIGIQNVALPDYIDKDVFDHLMSLEKPGDKRDRYVADLKAHLSQDAVDAAVARLDEATKALESKGHVLSGAAWLDHDVQRQVAGKIRSIDRGKDGKVPEIAELGKVSEEDPDFYHPKVAREMSAAFQYLSDGYFTRDFVRAIAKPGWFDEEITLPKAPEGQ